MKHKKYSKYQRHFAVTEDRIFIENSKRKFSLCDVSEISSRFTEKITLMLFSKLIAHNYNYHVKYINAFCGRT
jgi:hypothetical protein